MADSLSPKLYQQAIEAALNSEWNEAVQLNKEIIKLEPQNIDALNRQAKAYMELGKTNLAKKFYSEALKVDPYNPIAIKNLKIIKAFKDHGQLKPNSSNGVYGSNQPKLSASVFLQEPGKTKIVSLLKVAEPQKLSQAFSGMRVYIENKGKKITVVDQNNDYLGVLPDDISHHLIRLIKGGNKYDLLIKAVKVNGLSVIIRETFRSKKFKNQPSFIEGSSSILTNDMLTHMDNDNTEDTEDADQLDDTDL